MKFCFGHGSSGEMIPLCLFLRPRAELENAFSRSAYRLCVALVAVVTLRQPSQLRCKAEGIACSGDGLGWTEGFAFGQVVRQLKFTKHIILSK